MKLYGGIIAENATQATARDILTEALPRVDKTVAHVHDELVLDGGSRRALTAAMSRVPDWAPGLPVAAEITTATRYS